MTKHIFLIVYENRVYVGRNSKQNCNALPRVVQPFSPSHSPILKDNYPKSFCFKTEKQPNRFTRKPFLFHFCKTTEYGNRAESHPGSSDHETRPHLPKYFFIFCSPIPIKERDFKTAARNVIIRSMFRHCKEHVSHIFMCCLVILYFFLSRPHTILCHMCPKCRINSRKLFIIFS